MAQSNDIEDVLSSVRRLVASDPVEAAVAPRPDTGPALILEPANRVTDPEDPFQTVQTLPKDQVDDPEDPAEDDIVGLAQAERDGRDAAHVLAQVDTETTAITVDLSDAADQAWSAQTTTVDGPDTYLEDTDYTEAAKTEVEAASPTVEDDPIDLADLGSDDDRFDLPLEDDAFRDLIAEIVRQELSGDLGERITRNVRKLVRREIRNIMASEDFD